MDKKGFTKYLEGKGLASSTITAYIKAVIWFLKHVQKEKTEITKPDVLKYLEYLKNSRQQQNITRKNRLIALNHYFTFLYRDEQIAENPCLFLKIRGTKRKTLHKIYTPEELEELFDNYYQLFVRAYDDSHIPKNQRKQSALSKERNALILSVLIYQGVFPTETGTIELDDLDLMKATLKIRSSKKHNARTLPLKAAQIGLFMRYLQDIRPKICEYHITESNKLFLPLPAFSKKSTDKDCLTDMFKRFAKQIKTIDRQFTDFKQLRVSVITYWIKTKGLRKTQYLAGHKWVSSTEDYLPNDLDDLIDDISKLHPF